ncbi:MAG: ABC transporter substrate-binding protein [Pseudomonadota bacterium]
MNKLMKMGVGGVVVLLVLVFGFAGVASSFDDVFKIPIISPYSGGATGWGMAEKNSFTYAIEEVNAKGGLKIGGKSYKVEMINYDSKYLIGEALTLLNRAIFQDKAKFLSIMGQHICVAAAPICNKNGVFQFADASGGREITNPDHPLTFRMMFNPNMLGSVLYYPALMKDFGVKTVAMMNPDDDGGYSTVKVIQEKTLPNMNPAPKVVAIEYYTRNTKDLTPVILRIMSKNPDLIDFGMSTPGDTALAIKQLREAGYKGHLMNSASVPGADILFKIAGPLVDGYFILGTHAVAPTPGYAEYEKKYKKDHNVNALPSIAGYCYVEMQALLATIQEVGAFDPVKVADALGKRKWNSILGPVRYMGKEKVIGFDIDRNFCAPTPLSRMKKDGSVEKYLVSSLTD